MKESSGKAKIIVKFESQLIQLLLKEISLFLKERRELLFLHMEAGAVVIAHGINMLHGNFRKKALEHCYLIY